MAVLAFMVIETGSFKYFWAIRLIAGGIAMVIIVGVTLIGADLQGLFQGLADAM